MFLGLLGTIKTIVNKYTIVGTVIVIVIGILLYQYQYIKKLNRDINEVTVRNAVLIDQAQQIREQYRKNIESSKRVNQKFRIADDEAKKIKGATTDTVVSINNLFNMLENETNTNVRATDIPKADTSN